MRLCSACLHRRTPFLIHGIRVASTVSASHPRKKSAAELCKDQTPLVWADVLPFRETWRAWSYLREHRKRYVEALKKLRDFNDALEAQTTPNDEEQQQRPRYIDEYETVWWYCLQLLGACVLLLMFFFFISFRVKDRLVGKAAAEGQQ